MPRELSLILKEIKVITDKIRDDEESTAIESDWKFAAMVLDRLCLITFTLFTIIATLAVLAAAPHVIVKYKTIRSFTNTEPPGPGSESD